MFRRDSAFGTRAGNGANRFLKVVATRTRCIKVCGANTRSFRPTTILTCVTTTTLDVTGQTKCIRFCEELNGQRMKEARTRLGVITGRLLARRLRDTLRVYRTSIFVCGGTFCLVRRQKIDYIMVTAMGNAKTGRTGQDIELLTFRDAYLRSKNLNTRRMIFNSVRKVLRVRYQVVEQRIRYNRIIMCVLGFQAITGIGTRTRRSFLGLARDRYC